MPWTTVPTDRPATSVAAGPQLRSGPLVPPEAVSPALLAPQSALCEGCTCTVALPESAETARGGRICDRCRRTLYRRCEICAGWTRDDRDCDNDCDEDDFEDDDDHDAVENLVHDYEYRPVARFHGDGPLFLGLELEVETPHRRAEHCVNLATTRLGELGYLKTDASIEHGFEIVTHPMAYDWAIAHFPWPLLDELREADCVATAGNGLHVHLSRAGFVSQCHTYRWMKFIYRNQTQVTALARRSSPTWAAFTDDDRRAVKTYAKGGHGSRHRAINTTNAQTFELRVFASSLATGQVQAALGFASASVEYTRDLSVHRITHESGWTWAAFSNWLEQHPRYRPLAAELEVPVCAC